MKRPCVPCGRDFYSDEALEQHKRDSPAHKFDCTTCNRHFGSRNALTMHLQNASVHSQPLEQSALPVPGPRTRKPRKKPKQVASWSMYPSLHDEVCALLYEDDLFFSFNDEDYEDSRTKTRDSNIMGRFNCSNPACRAVWSSRRIAITIRKYPDDQYNARVYHQSCKGCGSMGEPHPDDSYAERVAYWLKKWSGVYVETPPHAEQSNGPHLEELCEGCKAGHCSQMRRW